MDLYPELDDVFLCHFCGEYVKEEEHECNEMRKKCKHSEMVCLACDSSNPYCKHEQLVCVECGKLSGFGID